MRGRRTGEVVVTGTLRGTDVEEGPIVLETDDGELWELVLPTGWTVHSDPGTKVAVRGLPLDDLQTTSQASARLRVRSLARPS